MRKTNLALKDRPAAACGPRPSSVSALKTRDSHGSSFGAGDRRYWSTWSLRPGTSIAEPAMDSGSRAAGCFKCQALGGSCRSALSEFSFKSFRATLSDPLSARFMPMQVV